LQAVDARQHQVESHQVGRLALDLFERGLPVARDGDAEVLAAQVDAQHVADVRLVVHDQDVLSVHNRCQHASSLAAEAYKGITATEDQHFTPKFKLQSSSSKTQTPEATRRGQSAGN
jgi:hypothetical protein